MFNNAKSLDDYNMERLVQVLREPQLNYVVSQIPDGAHVFHGEQGKHEYIEANLKLASRILLGMTLGYITEAPLILLLQQKNGEMTVVDLEEHLQKEQARAFIEQFEVHSQADMKAKLQAAFVI